MDYLTLSVYMKIYTFILWIMASDERREWWKEAYKVFIPLDINTRWNLIYLIISVARKY
jgi:hypothetical protein